MLIRRVAALFASLATAAGALVATPASAGSQAMPVVGSSPTAQAYAAMGESGAAGPLIPNQLTDPAGCLRSDHNYPHLIEAAIHLPTFRDVSCSAATTDNAYQPQRIDAGIPIVPPNPAQLEAVRADTRLVTLDFGTNDIQGSTLFTSCIAVSPGSRPCKERFVHDGHDEMTARIAADAPRIGKLLGVIRAQAPRATIVVVGKPDKLRPTGCYPEVPILPVDAAYIYRTLRTLNAMLARQAALHHDLFVDTFTPSIGHDGCATGAQRWTEPYVPLSAAFPWHCNAAGHRHIAAEILAALVKQGWKV